MSNALTTSQQPEHAGKATDLVSKGLILMTTLAEYDVEKETPVKLILKKDEWVAYKKRNIGSIEVLDAQGELEKVSRNISI